MSDELLARVRVVLCRPNHPGNIGATARAMKNMGLSDLRLVAPARYPAPEAEWRATGALDILGRAQIHTTLIEALNDCDAAFALTARARGWGPQMLPAREGAREVIGRAVGGPVALVFGNETAGLTNEETLACQMLIRIPANPVHSSLNLAQAVQVMTYELRMASADAQALASDDPNPIRFPATVADLEGLYAHLDEAGLASGFLNPGDPKKLRERWRRLFSRVRLEREEVNILRGLLHALMRRRGNPDETS